MRKTNKLQNYNPWWVAREPDLEEQYTKEALERFQLINNEPVTLSELDTTD